MIIYIQTDIFSSSAQTLVNTVNTVGVMGKGIAKTFKQKYPRMFDEYKKICDANKLSTGTLHLWRGTDKWVLNFPTKTTWKKPSELEFIRKGLEKFCATYEELGIVSISFPPLGCGNGQLEWSTVKPMMEEYLGKLPIQIFIHEISVAPDFVPEHLEIGNYSIPATFENFFNDIRAVLHKEKGHFATLTNSSSFEAFEYEDSLKIRRSGGTENIPKAALLMAWSTLQTGVLSIDQFNDNSSVRYKSYLFPVLAQLPYVKVTRTSNSWDSNEKYALLLKNTTSKKMDEQGNLWQSH